MAELTVYNSVLANGELTTRRATVAASSTVVYFFYIDSADGELKYKKSSDGGANVGSAVAVSATSTVHAFDLWFDKWTPGNTGTLIHIAYNDQDADDCFYDQLDVSDDSLTGRVAAFASTAFNAGNDGLSNTFCSITRAQGGNLYIVGSGDSQLAGPSWFVRSTDGGANWGNRTSPIEGASSDQELLLPGNTSDTQDIACIYWDADADALSVKMHDDSANSWTETSIATSIVDQAVSLTHQLNASIRHSDKHLIVVVHTNVDPNAHSINAYDVNPNVISSVPVSTLTQLDNSVDDAAGVAVCINQNNNDIYVATIGLNDGSQTYGGSVDIYYQVSTDDGSTWGGQVQVSTTRDDHRAVWADLGTPNGLFLPFWHNDDLNDVLTDSAKGVALTITAALTGTITASVNESDIVTGGKTLIITLTGGIWIAAGAGSFDLQRDEIIAGCDSAQSELTGWDLVPKATQSLGGVVRTSDTVVTITWDAFATYDITAQETITVIVPSTALVGGFANVTATPTFTISTAGGTVVKDIISFGLIVFPR